jgi:hypothetical protein
MDRSALRGAHATPRGPAGMAQSIYSNQDARSNVAVQPAANTGSVKLKKNAVKIVGSLASTTPFQAAPAAGPVNAESKEPERQQTPVIRPKSLTSEPQATLPNKGEEDALAELFARLNTHGLSKKTENELPITVETAKPMVAAEPTFTEEPTATKKPTATEKPTVTEKPTATENPAVTEKFTVTAKPVVTAVESSEALSEKPQVDLEQQYLGKAFMEQQYRGKAFDYLKAMPGGGSVAVHIIQTLSTNLRKTYSAEAKVSKDGVAKLKARYALAIVEYTNNVYKSAKSITSDLALKILQDSDGNLLTLYEKLAEDEYLPLADLNGIFGLCKHVLDVYPMAESNGHSTMSMVEGDGTSSKATTSGPIANTNDSKSASNDPIDHMKAWPAQEKRENRKYYCTAQSISLDLY